MLKKINTISIQAAIKAPWIIPLILGVIFLAVITVGWITSPSSKEELPCDLAKIADLMKTPAGGWCPNYMMGVSSSIYDAFAIIMWLSKAFAVAFSGLIGADAAQKLLILCFIPASAASMWLFLRKLGGDVAMCSWGALIYILLPSFHVASCIYEHWSVGFCFIFAPLILRGIIAVADEQSWFEIITLGAAAAAMALGYTKIAVVMSPMLILWTAAVLMKRTGTIMNVLKGYGLSLFVCALLTLPILIPAAREFGFAAAFIFDPVEGWKHHYSFKSPITWIDIWGNITKGGDGNLVGDKEMFEIGIIPLIILSLGLWLPRLAEWRKSTMGHWFLILTACWLVSTWFASGPDGILMGNINVLKSSQGLQDGTIILLWLAFVWMAGMIYLTSTQLIKNKTVALAVMGAVLVVPVFKIAEFFPLFNDIRAPESYWSVGGFCCLSAAVTISLCKIFSMIARPKIRVVAGVIIGASLMLELYPVHSAYWNRGLNRDMLNDFNLAASFLKTAPIEGRVRTVGSRYFYLELPQKANRPLDFESAFRHFELKWFRHLFVAGSDNLASFKTYLNVTGIAYILIDKTDPYYSIQQDLYYRTVCPIVAYENKSFVVLANPQSLFPAFIAHSTVDVPRGSYAKAPEYLALAGHGIATKEVYGSRARSSITGGGFERVAISNTGQDIQFQTDSRDGELVVVSMAFHPDWKAFIDINEVIPTRAIAALLAVNVPAGRQVVHLQFCPPWWYIVMPRIGMGLWASTVIFLIASSRRRPTDGQLWPVPSQP